MRLIDADKLSKNIYENVPAPYEDSREAKEECLCAIEEAPTIDAVPVVWCKDCECWRTTECALDYAMFEPTEGSFCSYGKKRNKTCETYGT